MREFILQDSEQRIFIDLAEVESLKVGQIAICLSMRSGLQHIVTLPGELSVSELVRVIEQEKERRSQRTVFLVEE